MKTVVLSLGGSLIVPNEVDFKFLKKFKTILKKHYKKHRFIIVCGGGSVARKYIKLLEKQRKSEKEQSLAGIDATRMNARFMIKFFGREANSELPKSMKQVKSLLKKNKVIFLGALKYRPKETSDTTASRLAHYLESPFINITNVSGLHTSDPKNKNAKLIPKISWKKFEKIANRIPFKPGQHFILDQKSSRIIRKLKIPAYIIGPNLKNLEAILNNKPFTGTIIQG